MILIRKATKSDRDAIRQVHLSAFPAAEGQTVARLAVAMLGEETDPATFALLAGIDGVAAGHVAFSPVFAKRNREVIGYILAPLGVKAEFQGRGVGSQLVESGLERLANNGVNTLFVYGDPAYYGKFGFSAEIAARYTPPYELQFPFGWQALSFNEMNPAESTLRITCVGSLSDPELW